MANEILYFTNLYFFFFAPSYPWVNLLFMSPPIVGNIYVGQLHKLNCRICSGDSWADQCIGQPGGCMGSCLKHWRRTWFLAAQQHGLSQVIPGVSNLLGQRSEPQQPQWRCHGYSRHCHWRLASASKHHESGIQSAQDNKDFLTARNIWE